MKPINSNNRVLYYYDVDLLLVTSHPWRLTLRGYYWWPQQLNIKCVTWTLSHLYSTVLYESLILCITQLFRVSYCVQDLNKRLYGRVLP